MMLGLDGTEVSLTSEELVVVPWPEDPSRGAGRVGVEISTGLWLSPVAGSCCAREDSRVVVPVPTKESIRAG